MFRSIAYCLLLIGLAGCGGSGARAPVEDRHARLAPAGDTYSVQRGDTLYSIAFRYRLDFRRLAAANGISAPYTIYPGQKIHLREGALPPPPSAATARAIPPARQEAPHPASRHRVTDLTSTNPRPRSPSSNRSARLPWPYFTSLRIPV